LRDEAGTLVGVAMSVARAQTRHNFPEVVVSGDL
jgi:hypothetical protein